jgi:L-ascorbate metabolism protein UlaG (beta-lactamase superfamily)
MFNVFRHSFALPAAAFAVAFLLSAPAPILSETASAEAPLPGAILSSSADPAKVLVTYAGVSAQVEITSPSGIRVYVDVNKPSAVTSAPGPADILCYTHSHYDHRNMRFQKAFPGRIIDMEAGEFDSGDVHIVCIPAAHDPSQAIGPETSNDFLFLIETGGLRILHTGDLGQLACTEDQVKAFGGRVDLLIQQFDNSYSEMSVDNGHGFNLLAQLKPRLVIPAHTSTQATRKLLVDYPSLFDEKASVELSPSALPEETTVLYTSQRAVDAWRLFGERGYKR